MTDRLDIDGLWQSVTATDGSLRTLYVGADSGRRGVGREVQEILNRCYDATTQSLRVVS